MAKKASIGASIALDGEKEFKQQMKNVNAELAVNKSQMSLVAAQYATAGNSQEALTANTKALQAAVISQTQKINLQKTALEESIKKNGEGSNAVKSLQTSLNKAETELAKMSNQLVEYNGKMQKSEKSTTSMADIVKGLANTVGVNIPPAMQGFMTKLDGVSASGAALIGVISGIVVGLSKMTIETAKTADDILTLSAITGLSTTALQEFTYAENLIDVSSGTMQGALTKLTKTMANARDGSSSAENAFKKLSISYVDGKNELDDVNNVFYKAIDALGKVKNETERDAIAMDLFGKSAKELNPLILAGSEGLAALAAEAHKVGFVMSEETVKQFGELDDAMQKMNLQGEAFKNSIAIVMLPILTMLFETIAKIPIPVLQTVVVLTTTVATIILTIKAIKEMTATAKIIKSFFGEFDKASIKTAAIVIGVVGALIALGAIIAVITGRGDDLTNTMNSIGSTIGNVTSPVIGASQNIPRYAKGTNFHPGGLALVGENGPEIVNLPRRAQVYPNGQIPSGNNYNDNRQYIFKVDDIATYVAIENRLKSEKMNIRQGVV